MLTNPPVCRYFDGMFDPPLTLGEVDQPWMTWREARFLASHSIDDATLNNWARRGLITSGHAYRGKKPVRTYSLSTLLTARVMVVLAYSGTALEVAKMIGDEVALRMRQIVERGGFNSDDDDVVWYTIIGTDADLRKGKGRLNFTWGSVYRAAEAAADGPYELRIFGGEAAIRRFLVEEYERSPARGIFLNDRAGGGANV